MAVQLEDGTIVGARGLKKKKSKVVFKKDIDPNIGKLINLSKDFSLFYGKILSKEGSKYKVKLLKCETGEITEELLLESQFSINYKMIEEDIF